MKAEDRLRKLTVTACGLGMLPLCPGTWTSAASAVVWALLIDTGRPWAVAGVALAPWAEKAFAREDPRPFVLDEVAGQWLTCLAFGWQGENVWLNAGVAFVAFRLFDVVKPPPIRRVEKLPARWGVMLDDVVAALYAAALLWVALRWIPAAF